MQISTREEDFIVDTLLLKKQLWILNRSFTNPNIVKVLHGSDSDLMWLQRDFGLFIVNLFDTGQAARILGKKSNVITSSHLQRLIYWFIIRVPQFRLGVHNEALLQY